MDTHSGGEEGEGRRRRRSEWVVVNEERKAKDFCHLSHNLRVIFY